jgi:hypothetical protein
MCACVFPQHAVSFLEHDALRFFQVFKNCSSCPLLYNILLHEYTTVFYTVNEGTGVPSSFLSFNFQVKFPQHPMRDYRNLSQEQAKGEGWKEVGYRGVGVLSYWLANTSTSFHGEGIYGWSYSWEI